MDFKFFIGIDVSKQTLDIGYWSKSQEQLVIYR
jgi:hypothetical protein